MRLVTASEMRAIDAHAINTVGIDSGILMENAGIKVLFALERAVSGLRNKRFTVVCGRGNNGGDGLVIARHLFNNGISLNVFIVEDGGKLAPDAEKNVRILENSGFQPIYMNSQDEMAKLQVSLEFADIVIDAVYGTGFKGGMDGYPAEVIRTVNRAHARKVSIDIPSGMCATTGICADPTVQADITITLGLPKRGLYLNPGLAAAGEIWVADIGIPQVSSDAVPETCTLLTHQIASTLLPSRPDFSHKGTFGNVLVLAGSSQYQGAAVLAGYGALRSGAGLVTLGLPEKVALQLSCEVLPDVILRTFRERDGGFALSEIDVAELSGSYRAIVAGPGWGKGLGRQETVKYLLRHWVAGLVLDADALNATSEADLSKGHAPNLVLTPHVGELARVTGKTVQQISGSLPEAAAEFAARTQSVVVLKSATSIICAPDGRMLLCSKPNSGLARGGSGDLLSGLIGGLIAQGLPTFISAALGTYVHSSAGEIARAELGADSMTVSETASFIPRAFRKLRGELSDVSQPKIA